MSFPICRPLATFALAACLTGCSRTPAVQAPSGATDSTRSVATASVAIDTTAVHIAPLAVAAILDTVRASGGDAVLVNVWASWCIPCREEMPDFLRLRRAYENRGLRLLLISADDDHAISPARRFLAENGVGFRTYVKTGDDMKFINTLSRDWSGALPASFIFDRAGHLYDFWEGRAPYEDIERRIVRVLDASNRPRS